MSQSAKSPPSQGGAPRQAWAKPAGESVLGEADSAFRRAGFIDATVLIRWGDIAGPHIARVARPAKWQDGPEGATLTLKCEAAAIVFLQHQTRELTERLNNYFGHGRIARLRLVAGQLDHAPEPESHPAPLGAALPPPASLSEALSR